jgi:hypothetical protein
MTVQHNSKTKNVVDIISYTSIFLEVALLLSATQAHRVYIILILSNLIPCALSFVWIFVRGLGAAFRLYPGLAKKANDANIMGRYTLAIILLILPVEWMLMYTTKIEPHIISASTGAIAIIAVLLAYPIFRLIEWRRFECLHISDNRQP